MAKTLLYHLFKVGKFPKQLEELISTQDVLIKEEGITVFIHYHNFESQGQRFNNKIVRAVGSICITSWGIYASIFKNSAIQLAWKDPKLKNITFQVKKNNLILSFHAETFDPKAKGKVEYRFNCKNPEEIISLINKQ